MTNPILVSPFFLDYILPFVLVFTLIFAVLQKTKVLGESSKQVNAIIGLVTGIILIAFPFAREIVVTLMPFLAISIVILFIFMLMYTFIFSGKTDGGHLHKGVQITLGILLSISLVSMVLFASGYWDNIYSFLFERSNSAQIWINVLLVAVIIGAMVMVLVAKESKETK